jgi:preprotein translocase subunit SecB
MKKPKVSKREYRNFIKGLTLNEIKMTFLKATVDKNFGPPADLFIKDKATFESSGDNTIEVSQKYTLEGTKKGAEKAGFTIEIHYLLKYTLKTPMKKAYFDIYKNSSLRLHTWPYFRQCVHQMTLNMHLPPLVLDTIQIPT